MTTYHHSKSNEVYLIMEKHMTGAGFLFAAGQNEVLECGKMEEIMM